jgi:hypothetical protein
MLSGVYTIPLSQGKIMGKKEKKPVQKEASSDSSTEDIPTPLLQGPQAKLEPKKLASIEFPDGTYEGNTLHGKRHGFGVFWWDTGEFYYGTLRLFVFLMGVSKQVNGQMT